jgi:DNA-binding beta-propeller fold protein YncE
MGGKRYLSLRGAILLLRLQKNVRVKTAIEMEMIRKIGRFIVSWNQLGRNFHFFECSEIKMSIVDDNVMDMHIVVILWCCLVGEAIIVTVVLMCERAVVSTLAGGTNNAFFDGNGTNAGFSYPRNVAVDASGNVFVADTDNQRIRKVTVDGGTQIGLVTLRAYCALIDVATPARTYWTLMHSRAHSSIGRVRLDVACIGHDATVIFMVMVLGGAACCIGMGLRCVMMLKMLLNGERAVVSTLAGGISGTNSAFFDGSGTNAGFNRPRGVAVDASGNVFVADSGNQRIRKVTASGGTRIGPVTLRASCADIEIEAPA